ncbi:MAG: sigma-70 family RNA polymerase sigma factor [Gammaproteobacteria bacterium]|nr:sigma-70 family RNA polymerase sigma factor [Gammaproteobacteria bacterium]
MTLTRMDLVLEVREIDASIEYYTKTLGFELTGRAGTEGEQRLDRGLGADDWAHVEAGATSLVFVPLERGDKSGGPVMTGSIYLYPEDVDKAWDELHEHVEVTWPIRTWPHGMRDFGVRDVNGYWLIFGQAVDDLSPRVGTLSLPRLVDRAKTGDEVAFGTLMLRFQGMAVSFAYGRLVDRDLAEDAVQEAFLEAYFCLDRLRIPEAFGSWLRRIVLKQCDRIARRAQLSTTPLDETMADDLASTPIDVLEHARKVRAVRDAINALPEHERVVTVMFYVSEMPQKEIAEFLEVPVSTVKNRLFSARNRLRAEKSPVVAESLCDLTPSMEDCVTERIHRILDRLRRASPAQRAELETRHPGLSGQGSGIDRILGKPN